ncbi:MAG: hypothetical protein GXO30_08390 [Epsilonproteobacteria bacterium]|nr:hypothetical protein [Campylobacterota bacterium]
MKKIFLIFLLPMLLFGEYLYVGSTAQSGSTDGEIVMESITSSFDNSLKVGDNDVIKDIPIYVKTDSSKEVVLNISDIKNLKNSDNEEISTDLIWISSSNGSETTISDGVDFTILSSGSGDRDGDTIVGYIRVKVSSVAGDQTEGSYSFTDEIKCGLKDGSVNYSSVEDFIISAQVELVAVASFNDTSSFTSGKKFVGDRVDFGTFSFDKNIQTKDLYIKSNSKKSYKITFENTPDLVHENDSSQTIGMMYYFEDTQITAGTAFTPLTGKSDGTSSLGTLKFETEEITGSKLAGTYRATLNISISLE